MARLQWTHKAPVATKYLFYITMIGSAFFTLGTYYSFVFITQNSLDRVAFNSEVYRERARLSRDMKFILLWTPADYSPFYYLGRGQEAFIRNNCSEINCYVTDDKDFFGGDLKKFHAVAFNGRNILHYRKSDLPHSRSPHQKYIFINLESADYFPVCNDIFDDFFNWTSTYRLDSDIPSPYIKIVDREGRVVGPKVAMDWGENDAMLDEGMPPKLLDTKRKAAAWFVSNCKSRSGREKFVELLRFELRKHGLDVDIFGDCGAMKCTKGSDSCTHIIKEEYFFYLSLENSLAEDYVTEKLLTALQHDAVPVVCGGANYSRFLPPGSYLDCHGQSARALAARMARLMRRPREYVAHLGWRSRYSYHDPTAKDNVCALCRAVRDPALYGRPSRYRHFRRWWHSQYQYRCQG